MPSTPDISVLRILDAALNRASEGLRVVEDYLRMVLDDGHLARLAKELRHDLAQAAQAIDCVARHAGRNTLGDVGTTNSTASEQSRGTTADVAAASFRRTAEALRTIEEYGKLVSGGLAEACEQFRYRLYTLEKATGLTQDAHTRLTAVRLMLLVDGGASARVFEQLVDPFARAGVGAIQLREKQLDDRTLLTRAKQLVAATRGFDTLAIINDRPDIAAAVGADGVHLGQDDMSVADARKIVGPRSLIGVSTHNIRQARQAVLDGANYLGAGPVFRSMTKEFDEFPGLDYLRQVAAEISLPTLAIGGITWENVEQVMATGISRVAVASAVSRTENPKEAATRLVERLADSPASKSASGL